MEKGMFLMQWLQFLIFALPNERLCSETSKGEFNSSVKEFQRHKQRKQGRVPYPACQYFNSNCLYLFWFFKSKENWHACVKSNCWLLICHLPPCHSWTPAQPIETVFNLSYTYLFPGSFSHCVFWEMSNALTASTADLSSSEAEHLSILVWGVIIIKSSHSLLGMHVLHTLLNQTLCSRYNTLLLKKDKSKMSKQSLEPF